jgi:hypothetical protein
MMPNRSAASITLVPEGTSMSLLSIFSLGIFLSAT